MPSKPKSRPGQMIPRGENTWLLRVYLGEDPLTGKRRYKNRTVKGNRKEAERELTKLLRERDCGAVTTSGSLSVNEYLDEWLSIAAKPKLRASTYGDYEGNLRRYVRPYLGNQRLERVTPMDIQRVLIALQEKGLSARTVRYVHMILSSALRQAVKWRRLSHNPAELAEKPKAQRNEMRALSSEEVAIFLKAATEDRWGILFEFAIATGMRPSEIFGLQWKDIDLTVGTVIVRRGLTRKPGGRHLTPPKTERSKRTIPIPKSMVSRLREHKAEQNKQRFAAGEAYVNQDFVFAGTLGQPLSNKTIVDCHLRPILKAAGLPLSFRLYDLRHTCATLLLQRNVHPKIVSERLGHSTITLTLDTYSHVLPTMQQTAANELESLMFGAQG